MVLNLRPRSCAHRANYAELRLGLEILAAIHLVLGGATCHSQKLSAGMAAKYLGGGTLEASAPLAALSNRELQVFRLIGVGISTRGIAEALNLSIKTIETYREHLKRKLGVDSGLALARRAVQWIETGVTE